MPAPRDLPYCERLCRLDLFSLVHRRKRGDAIQTLKIINGIDNLNRDKFFSLDENQITRGHPKKIVHQYCRTNIRKNFFSIRTTATWNELPTEVVMKESTVAFKSSYDKYIVVRNNIEARA